MITSEESGKESNTVCSKELEKNRFKTELILAERLKNDYCDESGKETNPAKAAEILHQIALIYRKQSPHKISLIKCVGLLNACVIRNPANAVIIQNDICEVNRHILQQANAKIKAEDLIRKANEVKSSFQVLRNEVQILLDSPATAKIPADVKNENLLQLETDKISAIQHINKFIADKYKQITTNLSQFCEDVMGKPPCAYAIIGMGSLARDEITPYSDFEHVILLSDDVILLSDEKNYESYLEYFRWYSVIFHTTILNMRETIIPSLNIKSLNDEDSPLGNWYYDDITPRGISFDGMMPHACKFPLGRTDSTQCKPWTTELIKPVTEMLEYMSSEAELKHGYHLADILTKTCFVFGNEELLKLFRDGAENYRRARTKLETIDVVKEQVKKDMSNFSTRFRLAKLKLYDTINIKQLVYRSTTIFIAALARVNNISSNSCFDVINEMAENKQITQNMAHHLLLAIAIACEMRLRVYIEKKSQCDDAINVKKDGISKFLDIVGLQSTVSYFQIAYCLQCEVAKQLHFTKLHFYSDSQLVNITISFAFNLVSDIELSDQNDKLKVAWNLLQFDFDSCLDQLQKSNWTYDVTKARKATDLKSMECLANYLHKTQVYDEALEFFNQILMVYRSKSTEETKDPDIARVYHRISYCMSRLRQFDEALTAAEKSLQIYQNISLDQERDDDVANGLHNVGYRQIKLRRYDDALRSLKHSLLIWENLSSHMKMTHEYAFTLHDYGLCLRDLGQFDEAQKYIKLALEIIQTKSRDASKDIDVAFLQCGLADCLFEMKQFKDALECYKKSLVIRENISRGKQVDSSIAWRLCKIGYCHKALHLLDDALRYFKQSLEVYKNRSLDQQKDNQVALVLYEVGSCLADMHQDEDALKYLPDSLSVYKELPSNYDVAARIENIRIKIDACKRRCSHD